MRYISPSLRQFVFERADNRCEYCGLSQIGQAATFHVDHVIPLAEDGQTAEGNLALACVSCSLRKAARLNVIDPVTGYVSRADGFVAVLIAMRTPVPCNWAKILRIQSSTVCSG